MTPNELAEAVRAGLERMERASLDLAAHGWTLPMSLTPAETYGILDAGSPDAVDVLFVRLYEGQHFERLEEALLDRDVLAQCEYFLSRRFPHTSAGTLPLLFHPCYLSVKAFSCMVRANVLT